MAAVLKAIDGRFILSINDVPEIRATFDGFHVRPVSLSYTVAKGAAVQAAELVITDEDY